jgi:hypothetical protein
MISSSDFKTKSLVYWVDINWKSLLTVVISLVVSFDTRRGYQSRNHCAESMIISSQFQTESLAARISIAKSLCGISSDFKTRSLVYRGDIHRESLLTVVRSMVVSFNTRRGFQSRNHCAESMIISSRFQTESLVYWVDIHGKSLLNVVISLAVSFNTRRGYQS